MECFLLFHALCLKVEQYHRYQHRVVRGQILHRRSVQQILYLVGVLKCHRNHLQCFITSTVAKTVINGFKMINIGNRHPQWAL